MGNLLIYILAIFTILTGVRVGLLKIKKDDNETNKASREKLIAGVCFTISFLWVVALILNILHLYTIAQGMFYVLSAVEIVMNSISVYRSYKDANLQKTLYFMVNVFLWMLAVAISLICNFM